MIEEPDQIDIEGVIAGTARLTPEQGLWLLRHASIHDLGEWATRMAHRIHGDRLRTYVIDRNINYTNVCSAACTFCAFKRDLGDADAYVLTKDQLRTKLRELSDIGGTQVLLQGGMHPELPLSFYTDMLSWMRCEFPHIHLHAFSPPEFVEFVAVCEIKGFPKTAPNESHTLPYEVWLAKLEAVMRALRGAGLASIPGGGGEIFGEHVRWRIGIGKATSRQWLDVMRTAHKLGMNTSSTMMFGHVEGYADRVMHMKAIRDEQDRAIREKLPGRYVSFIAWPFQPENTPLGRVTPWDEESDRNPLPLREGIKGWVDSADCPTPSPSPEGRGHSIFPGDVLGDAVLRGEVDPSDKAACKAVAPEAGRRLRLSGSTDYLRTQAVSRLFLDNLHSIGSSWVTMGPKIGQIALLYGANDMGSVMMEENVVSSAGTTYCLNEATICRLIRDAGFVPAQRDNAYRILKEHDADGPDLRVTDWSQHRPAMSAFSGAGDGDGNATPQELTVSAGAATGEAD